MIMSRSTRNTAAESRLNDTVVTASPPVIQVAVGVIKNSRQQVLLTLRPEQAHQGGLWEFPGGKVENNEPVFDALVRELNEELGIVTTHARPLIRIHHDYGDSPVLLHVWMVEAFTGTAHGKESQPMQWVDIMDLNDRSMPAANLPIIRAVQLPDTYLITPDLDLDTQAFLIHLEKNLESGIRLIQLREKRLSDQAYIELGHQVVEMAHRYGARVMLNQTPEVFSQCHADGLHLNSQRLMSLKKRPVSEDVLLSASCHNEAEVKQANRIGADFVVASPVLDTLSHPDVSGMGWAAFQSLTEKANMPVYALGGLSLAEKNQAFQSGGQGIAAIRALWDMNS